MLKLERYRALAVHHLHAAQNPTDPASKLHLSMAISWASLAARTEQEPAASSPPLAA
jgi:hypothetical protein